MTQYVVTINVKNGEASVDGRMMVDWDSVSDSPDDNNDLQQEMLFARNIESLIKDRLERCKGVKIEENGNGSEG